MERSVSLERLLFWLWTALLILLPTETESGRVLFSAPWGSRSHQNVYVPIIRELAQRGHQITVITNYATTDFSQISNIQEIVIEELKLPPTFFGDAFESASKGESSLLKVFSMLQNMNSLPATIVDATYANPDVLKMLSKGKFDLVLVSPFFGAVSYPFAWHFKAPLGIISPAFLPPGFASILGDSEHPEHLPLVFFDFPEPMSLSQRFMNTVATSVFEYAYNWHLPFFQSKIQEILPGCPPLKEIEKKLSLALTFTHPIFNPPRTLPPQVIEIGGIHCRPARQLPENLEKFVSGSGDAGFIVFAVGSVIQMNDMPPELMESFVQSFEKIPQRVIWQWKGTPKVKLPKNVLPVEWLPQQDLLGHKNCRLFITHGGLNSLQEAVYHGVPVIGLPFGTDQNMNLARASKKGYAITLSWKEISERTLFDALDQILNNKKYHQTAKELSLLMRDQRQTPLERAVYWVEFTLRHNGTEHLNLGSRHLAPYQRALLDVYAILILSALAPIILISLLIRKCCCRRKNLSTTSKEQKKTIAEKKKQ